MVIIEKLAYPKSFPTFKGSYSKAPVLFRRIMAASSASATGRMGGTALNGHVPSYVFLCVFLSLQPACWERLVGKGQVLLMCI